MKKELLIAALAAGASGMSFADISLTGQATVKIEQRSSAAQVKQNEFRLNVKGTSGGSSFNATMVSDSTTNTSASPVLEEAYVKTTFGGLSVVAGLKNGRTGTALVSGLSAKNKMIVSGKFAGIKVDVKQGSGSTAAKVDFSGSFEGVKVKLKNALRDTRYLLVDTKAAGVAVHVETGENSAGVRETAFSIATKVSGVKLKYANIDVGNNDNRHQDSLFGNIAGTKDISGFSASTSTDLGKIGVKHWTMTKGILDTTGLTVPTKVSTMKVSMKRGVTTFYIQDDNISDPKLGAKIKFKF